MKLKRILGLVALGTGLVCVPTNGEANMFSINNQEKEKIQPKNEGMALSSGFKGITMGAAQKAIKEALTLQKYGDRTMEFLDIPATYEEFVKLPQAKLSNPFETAALTVLALSVYPQDKELSLKMLDYLRGPRPLSNYDKSFIADRFRDKDYVPRSYFVGATPKNDYTPVRPYRIKVSTNPYSYEQENMAKLFLTSGGADSPRACQLRLAKDGKWYLWEQFLLPDIRQPESSNPWA